MIKPDLPPNEPPLWKTKTKGECPNCATLKSDLAALKDLVKEMANKLDYCADWFAPPGHGHLVADEIREILNRPEVVKLMKEGE